MGPLLISRRLVMGGGLGAGALVAIGLTVKLGPTAPGAKVLSTRELEIVASAAEAMFPADPMPIDGIAADVAAEVDGIIADLFTGVHRPAFRYMLRALEMGTQASRGRRFSKLSVEERRDVLDTWSDPGVMARRMSNEALKLVLGMAYFSHPEVLAHIGWRTSCGVGAS